jgi:hypothetical protein
MVFAVQADEEAGARSYAADEFGAGKPHGGIPSVAGSRQVRFGTLLNHQCSHGFHAGVVASKARSKKRFPTESSFGRSVPETSDGRGNALPWQGSSLAV